MQFFEREIDGLREVLWSERDPQGRAFAPLADAYRRKGDLPLAQTTVEEGIERLPDFASGHVVAGWIHRDLGASVEAERSFLRVLELDPENTVALRAMGELAGERGSHAEAAEYLRRLTTLDPDAADVAQDRAPDAAELVAATTLQSVVMQDGIAVDAEDRAHAEVDGAEEVQIEDALAVEDVVAGEAASIDPVSVADLAPDRESFDFGVADLGVDVADLGLEADELEVSPEDRPPLELVGPEVAASEVSADPEPTPGSTNAEDDAESLSGEDLSVGDAFRSMVSPETSVSDPEPVSAEAGTESESIVRDWGWSRVEDEPEGGAPPVDHPSKEEVALAGEAEVEPSDPISISALAPVAEPFDSAPAPQVVEPEEVEDTVVGVPDGATAASAVPVSDLSPSPSEVDSPAEEPEIAAGEASSVSPAGPSDAGETGEDSPGSEAATEETSGVEEPAVDDFQAWLERNSL